MLVFYYQAFFCPHSPKWLYYAVSLTAWLLIIYCASKAQWRRRVSKWGWIAASAFCLALFPSVAVKLSSPYHWHHFFLTKSMLYHVDTQQPIVALTFDDGPIAGKTEKLLDVLKKHNAHATFFIVGNQISPNNAVVQRILDEGHSIGNHTWSHTRLDNMGDAELLKELQQTNNAIESLTGKANTLMRPPGGTMSPHQGALIAKEMHYKICMWNIQTNDTLHNGCSSTEMIVPHVMGNIKHGDVLLMHDQAISPATLDALLTELGKKGIKGVSVPELTTLGKERDRISG